MFHNNNIKMLLINLIKLFRKGGFKLFLGCCQFFS